jgi:hypothetical protein
MLVLLITWIPITYCGVISKMKSFNGTTLKYWGLAMDNMNGSEWTDLSDYEKEVVLLSIKYQMDLMSMSMEDVKNLITNADWDKLQLVMKHGKRIH